MRVIYLGNQEIGVRCLNELVRRGDEVAAVFALPEGYWERISGVKQERRWYPSVETAARAHGLPVYTPEDINTPEHIQRIQALKPEVLFSISWDQLLAPRILAIPSEGCFNLHFSLLPENRGHAPINWAVIQGYTRTGVTMHRMVREPDAGDVVAQRVLSIDFEETAWDVYRRAVDAGTELFRDVLEAIRAHRVASVPQPHHLASYGTRRRPPDGAIDWSRSATDVHNLVRGLTHPYPGAFTSFREKTLFIWQARVYENTGQRGEPGQVLAGLQPDGVRVATGVGSVLLRRVQVEGMAELEAVEWRQAYQIANTERLGEVAVSA